METLIEYKTVLRGWHYDLFNNPFQKSQMLNVAIPNNIKVYGDIDTYQNALETQIANLQMFLDPKIQKWFTLTKQVEFIKAYKEGAFKNEEIKADQESVTAVEEESQDSDRKGEKESTTKDCDPARQSNS